MDNKNKNQNKNQNKNDNKNDNKNKNQDKNDSVKFNWENCHGTNFVPWQFFYQKVAKILDKHYIYMLKYVRINL